MFFRCPPLLLLFAGDWVTSPPHGTHPPVGQYTILFHSFLCMHASNIPLSPAYLHATDYCNTIARRLRNIRPPPSDPPCVCHTPYNIGNDNIV